jgi:hypothetical protein
MTRFLGPARGRLGTVGALLTFVLAACGPQLQGSDGSGPSSGSALILLSGSCAPTAISFVECNGSVRNGTNESLSNVEVLILWSDAGNRLQRTDSALIEYNPILAGQTSPWQTIGTRNPGLTAFKIAFKNLLGGTISYRDERITASAVPAPPRVEPTIFASPTASAIPGPHARLGETITLPNGLKITGVAIRDEPATRFLSSSIGNRLVTATIRVENRATSGSVDVHPDVFRLRDESGVSHRAVAAGSALPGAFVFTRLAPGMTITGTVTFEVPEHQSRFQVNVLGATM